MDFMPFTYIVVLHFCEICLKTSETESRNGKWNRFFVNLYQLSCARVESLVTSIDTMLINPCSDCYCVLSSAF